MITELPAFTLIFRSYLDVDHVRSSSLTLNAAEP